MGQKRIHVFENDTGPDDANHAQEGIFVWYNRGGGGESLKPSGTAYDKFSIYDKTLLSPLERCCRYFKVKTILPPEDPRQLDLAKLRVRIDARQEWRQMFDEAWRLQRDFYWAPNHAGVDWAAMKTKYAALLPRIGTRQELNRLIGEDQ